MSEIWKDVIGYESQYEISSLGRLRSKDRWVSNYTGMVKLKSRYLNKVYLRHGYPAYALSQNNKRRLFTIHRMLAIHFIPNPHNYKEVNHIDGDKQNYSLSNLEWCTRSQNMRHTDRLGLRRVYGEYSYSAKLNAIQVRIIRRLKGEMPQRVIATIFNIAHCTVGEIHRRTTWAKL